MRTTIAKQNNTAFASQFPASSAVIENRANMILSSEASVTVRSQTIGTALLLGADAVAAIDEDTTMAQHSISVQTGPSDV